MALNNQKQQPIPVVPRQMKLVNPDGTPTRSGQLLLQQSLTPLVTFGPPGGMANATGLADGAIYVVQGNNSEVIYQLQDGDWHYIAGTMWGTLSPDQRPVGLGPNDAGFTFRSIDSDPQYSARTFVWSGSTWVETTAARFGTHANRLSGSLNENGMLYVETDRSEVIYQLQGSAWHFLAGTMWGTLSPDQRPTDLGPNDAGFTFRGTDIARQYIWSGTVWVETTPVGGAASLTHPNVVTKVGAAGQIVEGGITDASAGNSGVLQITAGGLVGIGTVPAVILHVNYAGGFTSGPVIQGSTQSCLKFSSASGGSGYALGRSVSGGDTQDFWIYDAVAGQFRLNITGTGNVGIGVTGPTFLLQLAADSAAKPTSSTWTVSSDVRLKQNISRVEDDSLAILEKLEWSRFEYTGSGNMPQGEKAIGLSAQHLREHMPDAVRSTRGRLSDDSEETDLLAIDYHHIIVHSARAIQQLDAEVKRLRAIVDGLPPH